MTGLSDVATIVGNGKSRLDFDLNVFARHSEVWGCNGLYRDFTPDRLVAIDDGIVLEIISSGFPLERFVRPPSIEHWEPEEMWPGTSFLQRPRGNAGVNAMREAIKTGKGSLLCVGFDFMLASDTGSVSNVYDGTENYGPETRASARDNIGRLRYLDWVVSTNPSVGFCFLFPERSGAVHCARELPNMFLSRGVDDCLAVMERRR